MGWSKVGEGEFSKGCIVCLLIEAMSAWSYQRSTRCTTIGTTIDGIRCTIIGTTTSTTIGTIATRETRGTSQFRGSDEHYGGMDG